MRNKPITLSICWVVLVALSLTLPQLFRPPEGVDLAPRAGLVFLIFALISIVIAFYLFGHVVRRRASYSAGAILIGLSPLMLTIAGILWVVLEWQTTKIYVDESGYTVNGEVFEEPEQLARFGSFSDRNIEIFTDPCVDADDMVALIDWLRENGNDKAIPISAIEKTSAKCD